MLLVHMDVLVCGSCSQQLCPLRMVKKWCGIKYGCAGHPGPGSSFPFLLLPSIALTFPCVHSLWIDVICKYFHSPRYFSFLRGHYMLLPAESTGPCFILMTYFLCDFRWLAAGLGHGNLCHGGGISALEWCRPVSWQETGKESIM